MINTNEQTALKSIKDAFKGEDMQTQYRILGYRIDLYLEKHKFAIEIDELGHADRNLSSETVRKRALQKNLIVCLLELILKEKISLFSKI